MGEGDNAMFHNILTLNNGIKIPQLGLGTWFIHDDIVVDAIKEAVSLPKTGNPEHMMTNAEVDFEISPEDMKILKNFKHIEDYGQSSHFLVYGGKM